MHVMDYMEIRSRDKANVADDELESLKRWCRRKYPDLFAEKPISRSIRRGVIVAAVCVSAISTDNLYREFVSAHQNVLSHAAIQTQYSPMQKVVDANSTDKGNRLKVVYSLPNPDSRYFITVDDGWFTNKKVLDIMEKSNAPITAFVIGEAMANHPDYWKSFVAAGGVVGDHTETHPDLDALSLGRISAELGSSEKEIMRTLGVRPILFRPPYGAFNSNVANMLKRDNFRYIVMWNAEIKNGVNGYSQKNFTLEKVGGAAGIQAGDIILLHWVPHLDRALNFVVEEGKKNNLKPGRMTDYLN